MGSVTLIADRLSVRYLLRGAPLWERLRGHARANSSVEAVSDVSFTLSAGETVGVVGTNGSGKSTLLRACAGLLPASTGSVHASADPVLLGVNAALHPKLSGWRNITLGLAALGSDVSDDVIADIVTFSGLTAEQLGRPFQTYSSGMKTRLAFSISTAVTPQLLMVDEALAVGDEAFRAQSHERIRQMCEQAGTVVIVSHSLSSLRDQCDRLLWLDAGQLVADGPADEVADRYRDHLNERERR